MSTFPSTIRPLHWLQGSGPSQSIPCVILKETHSLKISEKVLLANERQVINTIIIMHKLCLNYALFELFLRGFPHSSCVHRCLSLTKALTFGTINSATSLTSYASYFRGRFHGSVPGGGVGGYSLISVRYVRPQRVWFFSRFSHK